MSAPEPVPVRILTLPGRDAGLPLPAYATPGAAAMDLAANLPPDERAAGRSLAPGARSLIPTGLALEIPEGFEIQVRPRSGLALRDGLTLLNSPGTIDCDYRGELGVIVINLGAGPLVIAHGSRIAQILLAPVTRFAWCAVESLSASDRGAGGFGSTGTTSDRGE